MINLDELKKLAIAARAHEIEVGSMDTATTDHYMFYKAANPKTVLALISELERLKSQTKIQSSDMYSRFKAKTISAKPEQ